MLVMILASCSTPQPSYYYKHHTKHKGFSYERHNKIEKKMVKKMKRENKRPGKTYFIISVLKTDK